jgi:hypothetical protein
MAQNIGRGIERLVGADIHAGDLASTFSVAVGVQVSLGVRGFAWANAALGLLWFAVSLAIGRRYRRLSRAHGLQKHAENKRIAS